MPDKTNIHLRVNRSDWILIRRVYGRYGGAFAESVLASRVLQVAGALRKKGIVTFSKENRKRLLEICA